MIRIININYNKSGAAMAKAKYVPLLETVSSVLHQSLQPGEKGRGAAGKSMATGNGPAKTAEIRRRIDLNRWVYSDRVGDFRP
jgi:hypothetical protein